MTTAQTINAIHESISTAHTLADFLMHTGNVEVRFLGEQLKRHTQTALDEIAFYHDKPDWTARNHG